VGSDAALGSNLSKGYTDTLVDLSMDTLRSLAAGVVLLSWARRRPR
jgi:hypothetical protein